MQHSIHYTAATQLTNKVQQLDVAKNVFTFSIVTPRHLHFPLGVMENILGKVPMSCILNVKTYKHTCVLL